MRSIIARFSGYTQYKITLQFDGEGQPLYSGNDKAKYITENRNLYNCMADSGAGTVVVVIQTGKLWSTPNYIPTTNQLNSVVSQPTVKVTVKAVT